MNEEYHKVIVCTPTYNRRWAYAFSRDCLNKQIEKDWIWIVVDNSDDQEKDWSFVQGDPRIDYTKIEGKQPIGWLRNKCIEIASKYTFDYLVFWDDDDYYPPTRISSGIYALEKNSNAEISGSSRMYLLLSRENVMMITGPFQQNHSTAATWTIRKRYLEKHRFVDSKGRGEEFEFTREWTTPMAQVPSEECIVVMGHSHNTVNKSMILESPQSYRADILNADNGRMMFRSRWPVDWSLWKSTFMKNE